MKASNFTLVHKQDEGDHKMKIFWLFEWTWQPDKSCDQVSQVILSSFAGSFLKMIVRIAEG